MDFYLRFLSTIPDPVQLFLNLVKTGFIGGIPVDKLPRRLYNGTGKLNAIYSVCSCKFAPWRKGDGGGGGRDGLITELWIEMNVRF